MHSGCHKRLFGTSRPVPVEVDPANLHLFGLKMAGRVTLSGVQKKIALTHVRGSLRVAAGASSYILKPQEDRFPDVPQNEHLSMVLASLVGVEIPDLGLVELRDESLALLIRRFDRENDGHRLPMEDFCQLAEQPPAEKYEGSAELCSRIINRYASETLVDQRSLFRLVLVSWWLGNGDLHLKNLALLSRERDIPKLSPAYDIVNTAIVIPGDQLALPVSGKRSNFKPRDWLKFGQYCGLPDEVVEFESMNILKRSKDALGYVRDSFLRPELKDAYLTELASRSLAIGDLAAEARRTRRGRRKIAHVAHLVRLSFQQNEIDLKRTPLEKDLEELEWLSRYEPILWDPRGAVGQDAERTIRAFIAFTRLDRIQRAFERCSRMAGFEQVVRGLRGLKWSLAGPQGSQAWDRLFEIELASLLDAKHWTISFRETDLVFTAGDEFGIECKRPRKKESIVRNVADACKQLQRRGLPGIVAVDLSMILKPYLWLQAGSDVSDACRTLIEPLVERAREELSRVIPTRMPDETGNNVAVAGVLFCSTFVVFAQRSGGYEPLTHLEAVAFANPAEPALLEVVDFFRNVIVLGQRELMQDG
jgi:serine/threonine-protein kinase HipA